MMESRRERKREEGVRGKEEGSLTNEIEMSRWRSLHFAEGKPSCEHRKLARLPGLVLSAKFVNVVVCDRDRVDQGSLQKVWDKEVLAEGRVSILEGTRILLEKLVDLFFEGFLAHPLDNEPFVVLLPLPPCKVVHHDHPPLPC